MPAAAQRAVNQDARRVEEGGLLQDQGDLFVRHHIGQTIGAQQQHIPGLHFAAVVFRHNGGRNPQRPGNQVFLRVQGSLFAGDLAAVHKLLHHRMITRKLPDLPPTPQIRTRIACMHHMRHVAKHICTDAGGPHTKHFGVRSRLFVHGPVGDIEPMQDKLFFLPVAQCAQLAVKVLQHAGCGDGGSDPPAFHTAHAVTDNTPSRAIGQLPGTEIVLVLLAAAANVSEPCDLHWSDPFLVVGRHPPAAAGHRPR